LKGVQWIQTNLEYQQKSWSAE